MDSAQTLDLLPCPFCGGTDFYARGIDGMPYCGNCGAQSGRLDWNTRAALPSPAIKPLVWRPHPGDIHAVEIWSSSDIGGPYCIEHRSHADVYDLWLPEATTADRHDTLDAAKAAAQADYEARIRSALTTEGEG